MEARLKELNGHLEDASRIGRMIGREVDQYVECADKLDTVKPTIGTNGDTTSCEVLRQEMTSEGDALPKEVAGDDFSSAWFTNVPV